MSCKLRFPLQSKRSSAFATAFLLLLGISANNTLADSDPRDYLQRDWYVIEFVVFEPEVELPSSEHLIHGVRERVYPADIRSLTFVEYEAMRAMAKSSLLEFHSQDGSDGLYETDQSKDSYPSVSNSTGNALRLSGCWLHSPLFPLGSETIDSQVTTPSSLEEHDGTGHLFDELDQEGVLLREESRTRDSTLPDWLPDDWESTDVILQRAGRLLGLCDEEIQLLLRYERLVREQTPGDTLQSQSTMSQVTKAFSQYESELLATVGKRRPDNQLNLQRTASRLRSEGYRVIDHAAWHQDALSPGTGNSILLQFGNTQRNGLYEVEGMLDLSVARFLHLDLEIWRTLASSNEASAEQSFESRLLFYLIDESRRLALGETHYFDHPKFGMLIQVRRLPVPPELEALVQERNG